MSEAKLTEQEWRFVQAYLVDAAPGPAALKAGYPSAAVGKAMLERKVIRDVIEAEQKARAERCQVDPDWVLDHLREIVNRSMQLSQVVGPDGRPAMHIDEVVGEVKVICQYDARAALQALQLIGKHIGMFVDRFEGSVEDKSVDKMEVARRVAALLNRTAEEKRKQLQ